MGCFTTALPSPTHQKTCIYYEETYNSCKNGYVYAVVYWGVYTGIRRKPTSGVFLTAYTHLSDHK